MLTNEEDGPYLYLKGLEDVHYKILLQYSMQASTKDFRLFHTSLVLLWWI